MAKKTGMRHRLDCKSWIDGKVLTMCSRHVSRENATKRARDVRCKTCQKKQRLRLPLYRFTHERV